MSTVENEQNAKVQKENKVTLPKWRCKECDFEFYGLSIVCPSCEMTDVEEIKVGREI
ncbi:hypothetical protein LYSIN_01198 [Lysinibacillus sphaericus]|uniref:Uncharacterized protein n=1 Tax=Lysinibacillus sphaericus TaxID=1421 RepID=A0A2S5D037_LYSSH|nr:hypothetical protein [Lysinibacillus sphaericus]POZ56415.1 hypothetical protein LYSIN_01198 [Lysinibacillus sphaericus]